MRLKCKVIQAGEFLWSKNDSADSIYFIIKGNVYLMMDNPYFNPHENSHKMAKNEAQGEGLLRLKKNKILSKP